MKPTLRIGIAVFDGIDELDVIGPFEVLSTAKRFGADLGVELASLKPPCEVETSRGLTIHSQAQLDGKYSLLVVPGGGWADGRQIGVRAQVEEGTLPERIAHWHSEGATIASVCTGAMLVAAAGLSKNRPVSTHAVAREDLKVSGAIFKENRVVDDGDLLSCGGVTSGIDLALWIVEREFSRQLADQVAAQIDYARSDDVYLSPPDLK